MKLLPGFFLLLVSWLQPMHIFPWVSWHSEVLVFVAVLAMLWELVYRAVKQGSSDVLAIPLSAVPLCALGVILCIQWGAGLIVFGGDVLVYVAYLLLCMACISVGFTSAREGWYDARVLASILIAGAISSAIIAFAQTFQVWESFEWIHRSRYFLRTGANLGQPNQLATLLLMGMVSVLYLFERRKLGVLLSNVLFGVLLAALAATESRAGILGFCILNIWWFAKRKAIPSRMNPWFAILSAIAFVSMFWTWPLLLAEVYQNGVSTASTANTVAYNRWIIWPQLLQAMMLRPWSGWGFGQMSTAHNAVVDAYSKSELYTYSHNIVLDFALGIGIPATVLLLLMVGTWLWRRLQTSQQLGPWYCIAAIIPVATHSLVEFPYAYAYFLVPIMLSIGALEGMRGAKPILQLGVKSLAAGLLVATAAAAWSIPEYLNIEEDFRVVRFESLHIGKARADYQRPEVHLFTQLDALLHGGRVVPRPNMPDQEIELARLVALHFPMIATQNRYALSLALNGNPEEALRQLRVMRAQQEAKTYSRIKEAWVELAKEKYPQLLDLQLP